MKYLFFLIFLVPSISSASLTFDSLEDFCKEANPIKLDLQRRIPLNKFWDSYKEISQTRSSPDTVVYELSNPDHVYIIVFPRLTLMNSILGRPTVFLTEGGRIVTHEEAANPKKTYEGYVGHDLQESLLKKFSTAFNKVENKLALPAKAASRWLCPEANFWKGFIQPKMNKGNEIILIGAALDKAPVQSISHELHHALFYRNLNLRKLIEKFWDNEVSAKDKKEIQKILHEYEYDVYDNRELLLNEFFAYLLETRPQNDILAKFVDAYAQKIREYLINNGVEIPEV